MKQLFEYTDNVLLMKDFIFPYLNDRICYFENSGGDLESLRCVCKKLNKIIVIKKWYCKQWKNKCTIHCKAYPFYKYLNDKYKEAIGYIHNTNIHFLRSERYLANMFLIHFRDKICTNNVGKLKTCCGGLGFKIIS
jgi:hypothetical protein